jgi:glycosyl transferase family 87
LALVQDVGARGNEAAFYFLKRECMDWAHRRLPKSVLSALATRQLKILWEICDASEFRNWWAGRRHLLLGVASALMLVAALVWLAYEFWRLLWQAEPWGAIDLKTLHRLVHDWFAGLPVYSTSHHAIHPPATYILLWPLVGWLSITPARWSWAITVLAALVWLSFLTVRESGAEDRWERRLAALMPISAYATGAAIGNGQVIVHLLPMLVTGLLLLRHEANWRSDLLAGLLILFTFVKPSISAPFFWIMLFAANSLRPALVVALGYTVLTCSALWFQYRDVGTLFGDWVARSSAVALTPGQGNVSNLHIWLSALGLEEWILPASLLLLMMLGVWTYLHRRVDLWLLIGVTAYIARLWTYHRWYDDLLILLPMIALFRVAKQRTTYTGADVVAGALLALTILAMLAPGGLFLFPPPWNTFYVAVQVFIWLAGLIFLADQARFERRVSVR